MDYMEQLSLDTPLRLFIRKLWQKSCQEGGEGQRKKEIVFQNRLALPHWTPSKYHTAPILEVVNEIGKKLVTGIPLIKVYNSNLNPRNRRAYNDRYILLITAYKSLIIDINRRTTIQFRQDL